MQQLAQQRQCARLGSWRHRCGPARRPFSSACSSTAQPAAATAQPQQQRLLYDGVSRLLLVQAASQQPARRLLRREGVPRPRGDAWGRPGDAAPSAAFGARRLCGCRTCTSRSSLTWTARSQRRTSISPTCGSARVRERCMPEPARARCRHDAQAHIAAAPLLVAAMQASRAATCSLSWRRGR